VDPTNEPPAPPAVTLTCGATEFLRGGKYRWQNGAWTWLAPRCVPRPGTWKDGCAWKAGAWARVNGKMVYTKGQLDCPTGAAPEPPRPTIVYATELPPPPPRTAKPAKCTRVQVAYPARYVWNGTTKAWDWRDALCVERTTEYKTCKLVPGNYVTHEGRVYYVRPAWQCKGKPLVYVNAKGAAWTPPETHKVFLGWKACRAGLVHDATGKCGLPPCPEGTTRKGAKCVAPPAPPAPCPEGTVRKGKRCVAPPAPAAPCPEGTVRKGKRCVAPPAPLPPCPEGQVRAGKRCVCPKGKIMKAGQCEDKPVARPRPRPAGMPR